MKADWRSAWIEQRQETDEEVHARLDNDYSQCKEILSREVPGTNVQGTGGVFFRF